MLSTCRVCKAQLPAPVVVLNRMPLTDDFVSVKNVDRKEYLETINIHECVSCGIVQNPADFDHEDYYQDYQYSAGHSSFVRTFMKGYAEVICQEFVKLNGRPVSSVLEIGSGDGEQLKQFSAASVPHVMGVEPSDYLGKIANDAGIPTQIDLFGKHSLARLETKFDVCLSSYTLDHVRSPVEYLQTAYALLNEGGILAFEVHDLEKIIERTEYCLFEHEHTIYLTPEAATRLVKAHGFEILAINPMSQEMVRGNSLIVVARKASRETSTNPAELGCTPDWRLKDLNERIKATIARIDAWIASLPASATLVGFGAGGRGVMTLAALGNADRFVALFDSNYASDRYLTPKTRVPIVGPNEWNNYATAYCLVYSYGYLKEIKTQLAEAGFIEARINSLLDFHPASVTHQ